MTIALIAVLCLTVGIQFLALLGMGPRRAIGDEGSYIRPQDPSEARPPQSFIRPPVLPAIAALCQGPNGSGERRLRLLMALASLLTVLLTALSGWCLGGATVALLAAAILAAQPERIVLACHVWPDALLGLIATLLGLVSLQANASLALAIVAGALCAVGTMTRIDFLVAVPFFVAGWLMSGNDATVAVVACLAGPTVVVLVAMSMRNARRYGIFLPDTTWAFNLTVMDAERELEDVPQSIARSFATWSEKPLKEGPRLGLASLSRSLTSPGSLLASVGHRLRVMLGPDTFVRENLLPKHRAYPELGERARALLDRALVLAFPALVAVVIATTIGSSRAPGSFALPGLALLLAPVLFFARTRFRLAAMPALSLLAADGLIRIGTTSWSEPRVGISCLVGAAALTWLMTRYRGSKESRSS